MAESLTVILVSLLAVVTCLVIRKQARSPARYNPQKEAVRLRRHLTFLEHRLDVAQREKWGAEMITVITDDQDASRLELARAESMLEVSEPVRN